MCCGDLTTHTSREHSGTPRRRCTSCSTTLSPPTVCGSGRDHLWSSSLILENRRPTEPQSRRAAGMPCSAAMCVQCLKDCSIEVPPAQTGQHHHVALQWSNDILVNRVDDGQPHEEARSFPPNPRTLSITREPSNGPIRLGVPSLHGCDCPDRSIPVVRGPRTADLTVLSRLARTGMNSSCHFEMLRLPACTQHDRRELLMTGRRLNSLLRPCKGLSRTQV